MVESSACLATPFVWRMVESPRGDPGSWLFLGVLSEIRLFQSPMTSQPIFHEIIWLFVLKSRGKGITPTSFYISPSKSRGHPEKKKKTCRGMDQPSGFFHRQFFQKKNKLYKAIKISPILGRLRLFYVLGVISRCFFFSPGLKNRPPCHSSCHIQPTYCNIPT